jgi:hypothetical protein
MKVGGLPGTNSQDNIRPEQIINSSLPSSGISTRQLLMIMIISVHQQKVSVRSVMSNNTKGEKKKTSPTAKTG